MFTLLLWLAGIVSASDSCSKIAADLANARFVPYVKDGKMEGYAVKNVSKRLLQWGIQENDLLVYKTSEELKAFLRAPCEKTQELPIMRSGKSLTLTIPPPRQP